MGRPKRKPPGPAAETLKIEGLWEDAVAKAMRKRKPPGGWPKPKKKPKRWK